MVKLVDTVVRQAGLIPMSCLAQKISIIGVGAVGSVASLTLAKMGFANQEVWDGDDVDVVNMNAQAYGFKHIGMAKVDALDDMFKMFSNGTLNKHNAMFDCEDFLSGIVVSALDSMHGRKMIYDHARKCGVKWLIDPRMSIEYAMMYVVDLEDEAMCSEYETTLYSDADAVQEVCTLKSTMYTSNIIGGVVCKAIKDIATGSRPFKTMLYDIGRNDCMFFQTATTRQNMMEAQYE